MSYWSHHPEKLDEITTENLPLGWKERVLDGEIKLSDVPEDIMFKAMDKGVREYWAGLADMAKRMKEEEGLGGGHGQGEGL